MEYPKFLKSNTGNCFVRTTDTRGHSAIYYRHDGEYSINVKLIEGHFISDSKMYSASLTEWSESNGQYSTPEYGQVHTCKMVRVDWNKFESDTGIQLTVHYEKGYWLVLKCRLSHLIGRRLEPITEYNFLN